MALKSLVDHAYGMISDQRVENSHCLHHLAHQVKSRAICIFLTELLLQVYEETKSIEKQSFVINRAPSGFECRLVIERCSQIIDRALQNAKHDQISDSTLLEDTSSPQLTLQVMRGFG